MNKAQQKALKSLPNLIAFYERIPASKWCVGEYINEKGQCCALGHLGQRLLIQEGFAVPEALVALGLDRELISVNDRIVRLGKTPRTRVLRYLRGLLKARQSDGAA